MERIRQQLDAQTAKISESLDGQLRSIQAAVVAQMGESGKHIQSALDQQQKSQQSALAEHKAEMEKLVTEQDRRIREMAEQYARMEDTLREHAAAEQKRQAQWGEMCQQFVDMQRAVLGAQREVVEAQGKAEDTRMALLRELFADKP